MTAAEKMVIEVLMNRLRRKGHVSSAWALAAQPEVSFRSMRWRFSDEISCQRLGRAIQIRSVELTADLVVKNFWKYERRGH